MHLNTQTDCSWAKLTSFIFLRTLTLLCVRQINFNIIKIALAKIEEYTVLSMLLQKLEISSIFLI